MAQGRNQKGFLKRPSSLAGLGLGLFLTVGATPVFADSFDKAQAYYEDREFKSAVIELKNLLQSESGNAAARALLGEVYIELGNAVAAEKELSRAAELGLDDDATRLLLARARLMQGNVDAVIADLIPEDYQKSEDRAQAYALQGEAFIGKQQLADARDMFNKALAITDNARAATGLARIAMLEGEMESALAQLNAVLERSPDAIEALFSKGQVQASLEDYAGSVATFSKIIARRNDHVLSYIARSEVYMRMGKLDLARQDADAILRINANVPQAHFIIARLQLQAADYAGAQASSEMVLRLAPQHLPSFFVAGSAHYAQGNFQQAQFYLEKFVSAQPSHLIGARVLGATYLSLKEPARAIELLESLDQNYDHQDAQILNVLGKAYLQTGNYEKGSDTLNRAIKLAPNLSGARAHIALAELAGGDIDSAISQLQDAEAQDDSSKIGNVMLVLSYLKKQDFASAEKALTEALEKYPDSGIFYNLRGAVLEFEGKAEQATAAYEKALAIEPAFTPALMSLAKQQVAAGNLDAAREFYRRALKQQPGHLQAHLAMAQLARNERNTEGYIDWLEKARKSNPNVITPVVYIVDYYMRSKNLDRALSETRRFQTDNPNSDQVLSLIARVQIARGELADAKFNLRSVIDHHPRDVAHRYKLAEVLITEKATDEAIAILDEILEIDANNLAALGLKAKTYIQTGAYEKVEATIAQVEESHPDSLGDEQLRGDLRNAQGDTEQALVHYQAAYEASKDPYLVSAIFGIYTQQNKLAEAAATLEDYLQANPADNLNRLRLATTLQQLGQDSGAIEQYELIRKAVPENFVVLNNLAWLYWQEGDNRALDVAAQAYKLVPERPEVADTYGWIMLHKGDKKQALKIIQAAASRAPTNPEILYHRAKALSENGEKVEAEKELKRVLRDHPGFSESAAANKLLAELQ